MLNPKNVQTKLYEIFTSGKFFSAKFVTSKDTVREINARYGVKKNLRGGVSTTSHIDRLLTVTDMKINQYRNIDLETVFEIKIDGETVIVNKELKDKYEG